MAIFDNGRVKLCGGIVVWDGVTRPETIAQGAKAGSPKWTLKVVFPPHCRELGEYQQQADTTLRESEFKGVLPPNGRMPIGQVQPGEFEDRFPGWAVVSFKTTLKIPDVYDENGAVIDPMQLASRLYTGATVDVLAHCYAYNSAGNRGIGAGLDAFAIIASANTPPLQLGGGGINTAQAFGGGAPAAPQQGYQQPAQAHDYLPPQQ